MGKERILEVTKKKKVRTSRFVHVSEIIPGVLKDIEQKRHSEKMREEISKTFALPKEFLTTRPLKRRKEEEA